METAYLDRALISFASVGRESDPARIEKLESMKAEMLDYAARRQNEQVRPMSYLYSEFELQPIVEMISLIAEVSLLQDFPLIDRDDKAQMEAVEDFDGIRMAIALLCYFTILVNENFTEDDYVRMFADSMNYYQEEYRNRMGGFWDDANSWKEPFSGCLFVRGQKDN
jgi:hypothetical protein